MNIEKFTDRAKGFLQAAQNLTQREHHQKITPLHLLKVLLDDKEGMAASLMRAAGADPKVAHLETEAALKKETRVESSGVPAEADQP